MKNLLVQQHLHLYEIHMYVFIVILHHHLQLQLFSFFSFFFNYYYYYYYYYLHITQVRCRKCNYYARVGERYVPYVVYDDLSVGSESFTEIYLCPSHAPKATWISSSANIQSLSAVDRGLREKWNKPRDWNYAEDYLRRYVRGYAEASASLAASAAIVTTQDDDDDDTADVENSDDDDVGDVLMDVDVEMMDF